MAFYEMRYQNTASSSKPTKPEPKHTAPYLVVVMPDNLAMLFQRESDGTYTCYDLHGTPDSSLDDWDLTDATIKEVN